MKPQYKLFNRPISTFEFVLMAAFLALLVFSNTAFPAEVMLAWDPNSESYLAGYKIYYENENDIEQYTGTGAGEGDSPIVIYLEELTDVNSPTFTLTGLEEGLYYYFVATAFSTEGLESDFSEEVGVLLNAVDDSDDGG